MYLIQDLRSCVGNCASFWREKSQGYTCNVEEAGRYTKERATNLTEDNPDHAMVSEAEVLAACVKHVRVDSNDNKFCLLRKKR
jgi:hypothetical protein